MTVPAVRGIDRQSQIAGRGGTRGVGDRERAGCRAVVSLTTRAVGGNGGLQFAVALGVDLLDDVAQGRIAAELREVDRARVPSCRV